MSGQGKRYDERRNPRSRTGDAGGTPAEATPRPGGDDPRRERLDTIEWADDRTAALDPNRGELDEDPVDDLLEGRESDADYRAEAKRVIPTIGPDAEQGKE